MSTETETSMACGRKEILPRVVLINENKASHDHRVSVLFRSTDSRPSDIRVWLLVCTHSSFVFFCSEKKNKLWTFRHKSLLFLSRCDARYFCPFEILENMFEVYLMMHESLVTLHNFRTCPKPGSIA